jgi:hypothetical protein
MASLLHVNADISPNWKEKYGIDSVSGPMNYVVDVDSTMSYFELKKILTIQDQLTQLLHTEQDPAKQQRMMMKFLKLREMEREILKRHKQVVFKSLKSK